MENVVPSVLQRLRAADVIRMAGLTIASLGQEYFRQGAVHHTHRQGAQLSGIVDVLHSGEVSATSTVDGAEKTFHANAHSVHYSVEVKLHTSTSWESTCSCGSHSSTMCMHAAALLYQWLGRPSTFVVSTPEADFHENMSENSFQRSYEQTDDLERSNPTSSVTPISVEPEATRRAEQASGTHLVHSTNAKPLVVSRGPTPLASLQEMLTQMSLSELRGIAREYDLSVNTAGKQQLIDGILETLKQTDVVRRVAATLAKPQRQLLAALTLAGGSISDDDLRGVYERFALGQPSQLQTTLMALQSKGFLFRTSLNSSPQQRIGLSGTLLDVGWFVPAEVRNALRVTVPVSPLDVERANEDGESYDIQLATPYALLADLLLVTRSLDGYALNHEREREKERQGNVMGPTRSASVASAAARQPVGQVSPDGSMPLPAPADSPSAALLETVHERIDRPLSMLHFAVRLLRLADIVYKDDDGSPNLRVLAHVAQLLLGSVHVEVTRDLFELWLTQSSYDDLFELRDEGLRLRCRATSLNHPMLRASELEAENAEARQTIIALLAQSPFEQWISFSSFARFVYRLNPLFLQKRQRLFSLPHWWIEYEEGRVLRPTQLNDWLRSEYYYLIRLMRGPLHWWGICDIANARDGRLAAFRLTPLARWLLNGGGMPEESDTETPADGIKAGQVAITAQDELLVPCTASAWPLIQLLERFAQTTGVQDGRLRYRLTPAALGNAVSNGTSPAPLLAALRELNAHGMRDDQSATALRHIIAQLERWIANYGHIRLYSGVALLEAADGMVMRELQATTSLEEQIIHSIHPTLHILKKAGAERLIDDLKRRSQTPLLHDKEDYGAE